MAQIKRILESFLKQRFFSGKAIILTGPRQVGKTTLIIDLLKTEEQYLFLDGDDVSVRGLLEHINTEQLRTLIGNYKIVFIDEAQRINNIGLTTKLITDQLKSVQVILSGSSALELNNQVNETLTGRKWEFHLYPISWQELVDAKNYLVSLQDLENRLLYGMYPEVINRIGEEKIILKDLTNSYLYKDILSLTGIKKPDILEKLLQALALQIGSEVSYNEIANLLGVNKQTVSDYIDLLEKVFVLFKLKSFSRNIRNELKSSRKVYFYDLGVRNMVINNFNPMSLRADKGAVWENFLIVERMKKLDYAKTFVQSYFWRTTQQQEIDYIEESGGKLYAYEFKWAEGKAKPTKTFTNNYECEFKLVNRKNFTEFIL